MTVDTIRTAAVRIGGLDFDPQTRTAEVAGRKTLLDARTSRVLLALADQVGDCVSKDALLRAGWPTQLVHENSLAKAISKLRQAVDGSGVEIAAVYGVGYSLRHNHQATVVTHNPNPEPPPATSQRPRLNRVAFLLPLCLVLVTAAIFLFAAGRPGQSVPVRQSAPITNDAPNAIATILWVDDHPSNNTLEVEDLRNQRIAVHLADSTGDALKLMAINRYQLVISDLGRGDDRLAGLRMIGAMKQHGMTLPVIIYTVRPKERHGEQALRQLAAQAGAAGLAVTPQEVRTRIAKSLETDA